MCVCQYVCFISVHLGFVCFLCVSVMGTVCLLRSCLPILSQLKGNKAALTGPWTSSLSWEHVCTKTHIHTQAHTPANTGRLIMLHNWQSTLCPAVWETMALRLCECVCVFSMACLTRLQRKTVKDNIRHECRHTCTRSLCFCTGESQRTQLRPTDVNTDITRTHTAPC